MDIVTKLALVTDAYCDQNCYNLDPTVYNAIWENKFAQLIVRECVAVMYDNAIERKVPPDIDRTPTHYAVAILEHFGVDNDSK